MRFLAFGQPSLGDLWKNLTQDAIGTLVMHCTKNPRQDTYTDASKGRESDRRRKEVIGDRLSDETLFVSLQRGFKSRFIVLAERLQSAVQTAVASHLAVITNTLDMVRSENVALESERDPGFRGRVERETRTIKHELRRLKSVVCPETTGDGRRVSFDV
jgi:hypothetical protein